MATIYSTKTGDTLTDGLQSMKRCDHALIVARQIARQLGETVILDDPDYAGELLVGPRGGRPRRFTAQLKLKMGFNGKELVSA